jgi:hypothetical protein
MVRRRLSTQTASRDDIPVASTAGQAGCFTHRVSSSDHTQPSFPLTMRRLCWWQAGPHEMGVPARASCHFRTYPTTTKSRNVAIERGYVWQRQRQGHERCNCEYNEGCYRA